MTCCMEKTLSILFLYLLINPSSELSDEFKKDNTDEYCQNEYFRPQCLKNEVILMKSATYGRMRIGRCITAEEVDAHRSVVGEDPRYLGCSVDVLQILDRKCSGNVHCDVLVADISEGKMKPCFPGLVVNLEASYDCISVEDGKRSCIVNVLKKPIHITDSSLSQRICGTVSQPWHLEAPPGQKISITLIDFDNQPSRQAQSFCQSYGIIVDKAGKQNVSICRDGAERQRKLFSSTGNALEIYFSSTKTKEGNDSAKQFILSLEAVGCSDIIPPEDTWLKRSDDTIVIGCYSSRQTWHLSCNEGKWTGVLGNCSHDASDDDVAIETEMKSKLSNEEQVLAIIAISGCTLAICLAIICMGAVCLRRFYVRNKKHQDYKTLSYRANSAGNHHSNQRILSHHDAEFLRTEMRAFDIPPAPTYSIYVGDSGFKDADNSTAG